MAYTNSWVSSPANQSGVGGGTYNFTLTIAPNSGDAMAVFAYWQGDSAGGDTIAASDNTASSYTPRTKVNDAVSTAWYVGSLSAAAVIGSPTTLTVSITSNAGINFVNYFAASYSGVTAFDNSNGQWQDNIVTGTVAQSGDLVCSQVNDQIVGFVLNLGGGGTQSPGSNLTYNTRQSVANLYTLVDAVNTGSGTLTGGVQFTHAAQETFGTMGLAFTTGSTSTPPPSTNWIMLTRSRIKRFVDFGRAKWRTRPSGIVVPETILT